MAKLWKENIIPREEKELYEQLVITIVIYGYEIWFLYAQERRITEVFKMMCLKVSVA